MPVRDDLGIRMKEYYEQISKTKLIRRTPVAIRIDGKAFHTFTRGFKKPFDEILCTAMQETMKYLCENIQGCVLGYTQSDEITLILTDYKKLTSSAWFDYEVQKMCSIAASMATMAFNKAFVEAYDEVYSEWVHDGELSKVKKLVETYEKAIDKGAMFDARCFNIPKEEVTNLIYWRQLDATRNSIQSLGQAYFSHKELHGKSQNDIQNMLLTEKDINWNNLPEYLKRGSCCIKKSYLHTTEDYDCGTKTVTYHTSQRTKWVVDKKIPIFVNKGREYIEQLINFE